VITVIVASVMTDSSFPHDALGNSIRKDDLVQVKLQSPDLVFVVTDVQPAGTLMGPDQQPLALQGTLTVSVTIPITFAPGVLLSNILVLKKPSETERTN
jgi:hypothetical protein